MFYSNLNIFIYLLNMIYVLFTLLPKLRKLLVYLIWGRKGALKDHGVQGVGQVGLGGVMSCHLLRHATF